MLDFDKQVPGSFLRYADVAEARDPRLKQLYAYWDGLRGGRAMPSRKDIDPSAIPTLLPFLAIVEVTYDVPREERFVVRLFGTSLVDEHGTDWTGKSIFDCVTPTAAERLYLAGDTVVQSGKPWISTGKLYWVLGREYRSYEVLLLPLSDDGEQVSKLLSLTAIF